MGLDQNIYRKVEIKPCPRHTIPDLNGCLECWRLSRGEEVAYFRKHNFLHKWVEDHLNAGIETNCEDIPFHLEAMAGLAQTCQTVIDHPELGPELLPTMGRFFFGNTDYDEYYLEDVQRVYDALVKILAEEMARHPSTPGQYVYTSSW